VKYNSEFESAYDVTKLTGKPEARKAAIEAFFTSKGNDLYAILPRWPEGGFLLKDVAGVKQVSLLGWGQPLKFKAMAGGVQVDLPAIPEELLGQPCWVLKVSR
jgi:alpha-L-fucosidase